MERKEGKYRQKMRENENAKTNLKRLSTKEIKK